MAKAYNIEDELTIAVSTTSDGAECYGARDVIVTRAEYDADADPLDVATYSYYVADTLSGNEYSKEFTELELTAAVTLATSLTEAKASFSGGEGLLTFAIPDGLYVTKTATAVDADLLSANIKTGITILGVAGTANVVDTTTGDAVAADIRTGKKAWVDGAEITGTVALGANVDGADGSVTFSIPDGLYESKTATAVDADLIAANIKSGITILGVAGTTNVVDTTTGDAVAADILADKKAWVDGAEVTGTSTAVETASGDAVAADILASKKAWVDGAEVTGTSTAVETGDATAVAGDIATGKTAYVNGVLITGTA